MANLLLTQRCVRSCPYCFAGRHMAESPREGTLSWEDLVHVADLCRASGDSRMQLLGGEPTLHPDFPEMVLYLLERGFQVIVFTSGVMSEEALLRAEGLFAGIPPERLGFLANLNDPALTPCPPAETAAVARFLAAFGERVRPGFNIHRLDFSLDFLLDLINRFGLQRSIRLGLSHPIFGRGNAFIAPKDMAQVVERVFSFAAKMEACRVVPGFDCGFPLCAFRDQHLAWLQRMGAGPQVFGCGPVVDIGPDLSVWPCFPLSSFRKRSLLEFDDLRQAHAHYQQVHEKVRVEAGGIFPACDACPSRERGACAGGCIAHLLRAFAGEPRLRLPEVYP